MTADGLRGIACLCVVLHHSSLLWFSWDIHTGWRPNEVSWLAHVIKLPIIRLLIAGPPQVAIFFVVSGYAISYKALKLARQMKFAEVGYTLFSSVFRRHTRLYMPAAFVTLCSALMTQLDSQWFGADGLTAVAVPTRVPPHALNLMDQLNHWGGVQIQFTRPILRELTNGDVANIVDNAYDPNLWTLPLEFSSSLVVFMFLIAFTRLHNRVRMLAAAGISIYLQWYFVSWVVFLFMGGMFICDLHFEIEELFSGTNNDSGHDDVTILPMWARVRRGFSSRIVEKITRARVVGRILGLAAFIGALFLLSTPEVWLGARDTYGYATLTSWVPPRFGDAFLVPVGAVLLVLVLDHAAFLQILFTNSFSQYMGKISFSLYLIHGPMLWSLGLKLGHFGLSLTGQENNEEYALGILIAACLWWPVVIYLADLTSTHIDENCVRFSKWAYGRLTKEENGQ